MLITLFIFFAVIGLALNALFLHLTSKLLKVELSNYKTALIITVTQLAITFIIGASVDFLLTLAGLKYADSVLSIFISFAAFHLLLQKYYKTSLQKNILIYILFTIITVVISLSIIIPTRIFIIEPFYVAGETMSPTYQDGDYLIINKLSKNYQHGDIVVFHYPKDQQQFFIKRIVALPGEKIQFKQGAIYLFDNDNPNGKKISEPYLQGDVKTYNKTEEIIELVDDEYYVLGDNRNASKDSRIFGPVSGDLMQGKVWLKANLENYFGYPWTDTD